MLVCVIHSRCWWYVGSNVPGEFSEHQLYYIVFSTNQIVSLGTRVVASSWFKSLSH